MAKFEVGQRVKIVADLTGDYPELTGCKAIVTGETKSEGIVLALDGETYTRYGFAACELKKLVPAKPKLPSGWVEIANESPYRKFRSAFNGATWLFSNDAVWARDCVMGADPFDLAAIARYVKRTGGV